MISKDGCPGQNTCVVGDWQGLGCFKNGSFKKKKFFLFFWLKIYLSFVYYFLILFFSLFESWSSDLKRILEKDP